MTRWFTVGAATVAMAAATLTVGHPGTAQATPDDGSGTGQCSWKPVAPTVVDVSDQKMVTASLERGPCTIFGNPSGMTVCLSIQGEDSAGKCGETMQSYPAQVYYRYKAGATYVMTGRGCVNIFEPPFKLCQNYGPVTYTL